MRLLDRLLVLLFVRRTAQAHARAVLADRRKAAKPALPAGQPAAAVGAPTAVAIQQTAGAIAPTGAPPPAAAGGPAPADTPASAAIDPAIDPAGDPAAAVVVPQTVRESLIRDALAARKTREAEWNALTPEQQRRAVAGLGEGMAALVKAFRAA